MKNVANGWLVFALAASFSAAYLMAVTLRARRKDGAINWAWEWADTEEDYHG